MTRNELIGVVVDALTDERLSTYVDADQDVIDGSFDEVVTAVVDAVLRAQG